MAMPPNYFDEDFDKQWQMCGNSTIDEKVDLAFSIVTGSSIIRSELREIIENHESSEPIPGPTLSQKVRQGLAEILNAQVMP